MEFITSCFLLAARRCNACIAGHASISLTLSVGKKRPIEIRFCDRVKYNMRSLVGGVIGGLTILYPLAVYFSVQYTEPWKIAVALSVLLLFRLMTSQVEKSNQLLFLVGILYCGLAVWNNNLITLRFYPVIISLGLFVLFVSSLFFPPPIIERLARLQHPDLPDKGIIYTRKVTLVWSVFFLVNGLIATTTVLWTSFAWWSLYNGLISYLLMGLLMGIEYLVRIRTQPHVR